MYKVYEYGTVELQLNLLEGQARARPKTIQLETPGKKLQYVTLAQKSDYHITIVPTPTGKMLRKLEMANPGQKPLFDYIEFLMSMYRWHILHTGVFYELKRLDPEKGDVYTIIELEFIPDYWDFYTQLRRLLTRPAMPGREPDVLARGAPSGAAPHHPLDVCRGSEDRHRCRKPSSVVRDERPVPTC
jgi:hypothetical protein